MLSLFLCCMTWWGFEYLIETLQFEGGWHLDRRGQLSRHWLFYHLIFYYSFIIGYYLFSPGLSLGLELMDSVLMGRGLQTPQLAFICIGAEAQAWVLMLMWPVLCWMSIFPASQKGLLLYVHCVWTHTCNATRPEVRGERVGVSSSLPAWGSQGSNLSHQLPASALTHWPILTTLK